MIGIATAASPSFTQGVIAAAQQLALGGQGGTLAVAIGRHLGGSRRSPASRVTQVGAPLRDLTPDTVTSANDD